MQASSLLPPWASLDGSARHSKCCKIFVKYSASNEAFKIIGDDHGNDSTLAVVWNSRVFSRCEHVIICPGQHREEARFASYMAPGAAQTMH